MCFLSNNNQSSRLKRETDSPLQRLAPKRFNLLLSGFIFIHDVINPEEVPPESERRSGVSVEVKDGCVFR